MEENIDVKRTLPHSDEAEAYVLGGILAEVEGDSIVKNVVGYLAPSDFYDARNRLIMQAIETLANAGSAVDVGTVAEQLHQTGMYDAAGGTAYLTELIEGIPSVYPVATYIDLVRESALKRELYASATDVANAVVANKQSFNDMVEETDKMLTRIIRKRRTTVFTRLDQKTDETLKIIEENRTKNGLTGLDTGFPSLNRITFGLQKGNLIILAARPSVGKSTLALNIATNACEKAKARVAFFSLEMASEQLIMRILSAQSGIDLSQIVSGKVNDAEMTMLYTARQKINKFALRFDDSTTSIVSEIKAKCRKMQQEEGLDLVVVDYLQLMTAKTNAQATRNDQIGVISRGLKTMAIELSVPVLALSQLSRSIDSRTDKRPQLSDLRDSGNIEQDADIVMFMYREEDKEDPNSLERTRSAKTTLIIAKNRQGALGTIDLMFKASLATFREMARGKEPNTRNISQ